MAEMESYETKHPSENKLHHRRFAALLRKEARLRCYPRSNNLCSVSCSDSAGVEPEPSFLTGQCVGMGDNGKFSKKNA